MNEQDYELLIELYKTKNITRTAQELFLTQPAVTKRLQNIERELKNQIILRSKHGIAFTPVGESLIPHARKILEESRKFRELAVASADGSAIHQKSSVLCKNINAGLPQVQLFIEELKENARQRTGQ